LISIFARPVVPIVERSIESELHVARVPEPLCRLWISARQIAGRDDLLGVRDIIVSDEHHFQEYRRGSLFTTICDAMISLMISFAMVYPGAAARRSLYGVPCLELPSRIRFNGHEYAAHSSVAACIHECALIARQTSRRGRRKLQPHLYNLCQPLLVCCPDSPELVCSMQHPAQEERAS